MAGRGEEEGGAVLGGSKLSLVDLRVGVKEQDQKHKKGDKKRESNDSPEIRYVDILLSNSYLKI